MNLHNNYVAHTYVCIGHGVMCHVTGHHFELLDLSMPCTNCLYINLSYSVSDASVQLFGTCISKMHQLKTSCVKNMAHVPWDVTHVAAESLYHAPVHGLPILYRQCL